MLKAPTLTPSAMGGFLGVLEMENAQNVRNVTFTGGVLEAFVVG